MQTYTHFLVAFAAYRPLSQKWKHTPNFPPPLRSAFWLGSALPDLPLIIMTIVCGIIDLSQNFANMYMGRLFRTWYFENKMVMSLHNLFHAPISCFCLLLIAYTAWRGCRLAGSAWWFWVISNAFVHAISDIPVHHNDGPLLLFPFNFSIRYDSPVSYYDPDYYGIPFLICEHILDLVIIVYECSQCCARRKERRRQQQAEEEEDGENDDDEGPSDDDKNTEDKGTEDKSTEEEEEAPQVDNV